MARKKKKKRNESEADVEMNMTPMIDVTFQLIVFFLLVMDFSSRDLVPLELAKATEAQQEETQNPWTVTVNIAHERDEPCPNFSMDPESEDFHLVCRDPEHWLFYARGEMFNFNKKGKEELIKLLKTEAQQKLSDEKVGGRTVSEVPIIIRADTRAPWGLVQRVMQVASNPNVLIYKVKLAANIPRPD